MNWIYRFTTNPGYPNPIEEIDALCALEESEEAVYLLLSNCKSPPLSGARNGDVVGLCTANNKENDRQMILHAKGVVDGIFRCNTPPSVIPIYGELEDRSFCKIINIERLKNAKLNTEYLSNQEQNTFLSGQAFVKKIISRAILKPKPSENTKTEKCEHNFVPKLAKLKLPPTGIAFNVVGLDPTAGTWESNMTEGPKRMPSFSLCWNGNHFMPHDQPLVLHNTNESFWDFATQRQNAVICIDGPCKTSGPSLLFDPMRWDQDAPKGNRVAELELSDNGVSLFWTTQNTVMRFDGASRWIARSLVLFSEQTKMIKIETHPHGAFTFFWRMFEGVNTLPKKSTPQGRAARINILKSFIPDLTDLMVPNHDAVDAACAALVAGLHKLGLTIPFGSPQNGGEIWMPNALQLIN